MKRGLLLVFGLMALLAAQEAVLDLRLSRDWGYGGFNNEIQGRFSLHASGPDDLAAVQFRMDGDVIGVDEVPPFQFQFTTDAFPPGPHAFSATGLLAGGGEIESDVIAVTILSADQAGDATAGLIIPLLAILGGITVFGVLMPLVFGRRRKHIPGVYGMAGGAVCGRCLKPFARGVLSPNMVFGKLERCPHCGKWAIVPRASAAALEAAEARLAEEGQVAAQAAETEAEKRARLAEESRFDN